MPLGLVSRRSFYVSSLKNFKPCLIFVYPRGLASLRTSKLADVYPRARSGLVPVNIKLDHNKLSGNVHRSNRCQEAPTSS